MKDYIKGVFIFLLSFIAIINFAPSEYVGKYLTPDSESLGSYIDDLNTISSISKDTKSADSVTSNTSNNVTTTQTTSVVNKLATSAKSATESKTNWISIGGKTLNIVATGSGSYMPATPTNGVALYGSKFIYGHNSAAIFGNLKNMNIGDTFTVNIDGKTSTYKIALKEILKCENSADGSYSASESCKLSVKNSIYKATYEGNFDLSIMTCAGTNLGGGRATHRLIIEAIEI